MRVFTSSRYANVTATLALVVALGGTGVAATALAHNSVGTPQLKKNAVTSAKIKNHAVSGQDLATGALGRTTPVAIISVGGNGHVYAEAHRAPITGKVTVKRPSTGFYVVTMPGLPYLSAYDAATCNPLSFQTATVTVDGVGQRFALHTFDPTGAPANIDFRCAIWKLK